MKFEELVERQTKEYADHIESVKNNREKLQAGKESILSTAKCAEADLPQALKDMLQRDADAFEQQYGMYGTKFKEMRNRHQKELNDFIKHNIIVQDLSKPNDYAKDNSADR